MNEELRELLEILTNGLLALAGPDMPLNNEFGNDLFEAAIAADVITAQTLCEQGMDSIMATTKVAQVKKEAERKPN